MRLITIFSFIILGLFGTLSAQSLPHDSWKDTKNTGSGSVTVLWHDSKPFHYQNAKGEHTGIDHDLVVALFDFIEKKYKVKIGINWYKAKDYTDFHDRIKNGTGGIFSVAAFSITPERKKIMQFSPAYMPDIEVIISHPDMPSFKNIDAFKSTVAAKKYTAVSVKNTTFDKNLIALKNAHLPGLPIKHVTNADDIINTVRSTPNHFGYIHLPIYALALKNGLSLKRQKFLQVQREGYAIMFPLQSDWNTVIDEFFNSAGFKPLLNRIIIQHAGTNVKELIQNVSAEGNKELALLTKENELQSLRLKQNKLEIEQNKLRIERHRFYQIVLIGGVVVILILAGVIYSRYQIKQKGNKALLEKNAKIEKQRDEIEAMHTELKDSISYAQQIQQAMMPHKNRLNHSFPENFVIYKPREMLSGDFYWLNDQKDMKLVAVADCAGRGVPGAFLTMLGTLVLNHVIRESKRTNPQEVLTLMDKLVQRTLTAAEANLAIKISLCCIDYAKGIIMFTGANSSLFIVNKGRLKQIKGNRHPIGKGLYNAKDPLVIHELEFAKGDVLYLMTDGFQNQLGGNNGQSKKFMLIRLKDVLAEINPQSLQLQKERLESELSNWQGQEAQTDDILLMGMQL